MHESQTSIKKNHTSEEDNHHEERRMSMAQQAKEASQLPVPDRYYAEYVRLLSDTAEEALRLRPFKKRSTGELGKAGIWLA
jgi:hypothetical protein